MKKRSLALMLLPLLPLLAGWIFFRKPAAPSGDCVCEINNGRGIVTVQFAELAAVEAADETEANLAADGWQRAPVCTPTFRLMLRGNAVTAFLAEDTGGRTRITMLQTRNDL